MCSERQALKQVGHDVRAPTGGEVCRWGTAAAFLSWRRHHCRCVQRMLRTGESGGECRQTRQDLAVRELPPKVTTRTTDLDAEERGCGGPV